MIFLLKKCKYALIGLCLLATAPLSAESIQQLLDSGNVFNVTQSGSLDLSNQGITSLVGLQNIPGVDTVIDLCLDGNQLTRVTAQDFVGLTSLRNLHLSNNFIEVADLRGLEDLEDINLQGNRITELYLELSEGWHIVNLLLHNNPLSESIHCTLFEIGEHLNQEGIRCTISVGEGDDAVMITAGHNDAVSYPDFDDDDDSDDDSAPAPAGVNFKRRRVMGLLPEEAAALLEEYIATHGTDGNE